MDPLLFGASYPVDDVFYDDGVPGYTVGGWAAIAPVGDDCALICWQSSHPTSEGLVGCVARWVAPVAEGETPTVQLGPRTPLGVLSAFNSNSALAGLTAAGQALAFNASMHRIDVDTTTLTATLRESTATGVPTIFGSNACEADVDRAVFWGGTGSASTGSRSLVIVDANTYQATSVPASSGGPLTADATQVVRTNSTALTIMRHTLDGLVAAPASNQVTVPRLLTDHTVGLASPTDAVFVSRLVGETERYYHYDPTTGALAGPVDPGLSELSVAPVQWQWATTPFDDAVALRFRSGNSFYVAVVASDGVTTNLIGTVEAQSGDNTSGGGRRFIHLGNGRYLHLEVPINENSGPEVIRRQAWVRAGAFPPPPPPVITPGPRSSGRRFL